MNARSNALLGLIGLLASIGHYLLIRAYDYAGATLLAPYGYTMIVCAALIPRRAPRLTPLTSGRGIESAVPTSRRPCRAA